MASEEKIAREWVGKGDVGFIPGVPARDLTTDDWKELLPWQKTSVDGSALYRKVEEKAKSKGKAKSTSNPTEVHPAEAEAIAVKRLDEVLAANIEPEKEG